MRRLGVLAGSFDPVHRGHTALAKEAKCSAGLDGVVLLPLARPGRASAQERLEMCRLAAADQTWITVSQAGLSGGIRYPGDALGALNREYPDSRFAWILGADELTSLTCGHGRDRLFAACDFICFPREGVSMKAVEQAREAGAQLTVLPAMDAGVTSEQIRESTAAYEDAPGLDKRVLCYMARRGLYQKDLEPKLKTMMNPRRFQHTLGVRREAVRLADLHGAPIQRCALAGLLHDCAKGMPVKEMDRIAREHHLIDDENMYGSNAMLHGPVGAYLAKKEFGVQDEEILNAIRGHTIGRAGMTKMELVIFVADATEDGREPYEGLDAIRFLADKSLPAAALKSMELTEKYVRAASRPFFPAALRAKEYLESILTAEEKALLASVE